MLARDHGTPAACRIVITDVSERKRGEVELREARDAAEAANRAKSRFLANMGHELRTPMNGVLGMAQVLLGTRLTEAPRRYASTIIDSGESLMRLLNDLLDLSKIEAGRLNVVSAPFDLHDEVRAALQSYAAQARETRPIVAPEQPIAASVLLVEDDTINVEVVSAMLAQFGCTVAVAGNGEQALRADELRQMRLKHLAGAESARRRP